MFKTFTVIAAVAALCAGCAAAPEDIGPSYASPMTYRDWTCDQLTDEGHRLAAAVRNASQRQDQARANDALGVVLIGLPLGSMSGQNIAPEIGRLKGEHEALYRVAVGKGCQTQIVPAATQRPE